MINRIYPNPSIPLPGCQRNASQVNQGNNFADILKSKIEPTGLKFSAHASRRLIDRGINLSENDVEKLNSAVEKISTKGSTDSLIVMDNVSYLVNIPNKTVITAIDGQSSKENVFTNIDSAMLI